MIPEGWNETPLKEVAQISMGQSPSSSTYNENGDGLYLIQGNADIKNRESAPRIWTDSPTKSCLPNDILMTVRAPVGAIAVSKHEACIGRGVCAIRAEGVEAGFLKQYLINYEPRWKNFEQGSTFTAVGSKEVNELPVLLPPLPEQRKIASILSSVDDAIRTTQKVIDQTEKVKQGLLQELLTRGIGHTEFKQTEIGEIPVGWEVGLLCDYVEIHNNLRKPINLETRKLMRGIYPYYGPTKAVDHINEFRVEGEHVLIGEDGDHFLKFKTWSMTQLVDGKFNVNNHAHILKGTPKCITTWIHVFFVHRNIVPHLTRQGAGRYKLNKATLCDLPMAIPPIYEQKRICKVYLNIQSNIEQRRNEVETLKCLKKGLMQDLLSGKVRVTN